MSAYSAVLRPALFRLWGADAEAAHDATLGWLGRLPRAAARRPYRPEGAARTVFGLRFPNPVGLAAGLDKDGRALSAWPALGFGFVEIGTVTWHPQPGNPKPRLFRLPDSEAIVNRMGFNNRGAQALADRLAAYGPPPVPVGISLGKSRVTPLDEAVDDYLASLRVLHPYADYVAINVSSPNTPGLRRLQDADQLGALLGALHAEATRLAGTRPAPPILVKIAPDLTDVALDELLGVCASQGVAGLIATNTTLDRTGLAPADLARGVPAGGLSGRPLAARTREVVQFVVRESGLPVVAVGGIMNVDDARRMMDIGASLIQLCTGLIYHGPALVRGCVRALSTRVGAPTGG